ncbi:MAG: DUF2147 domain-containing protein [Bdellovibrionales bacterium]
MRIHTALFFLSLVLIPSTSWAQGDAPLVGLWETEDHDAVVQFYACEDRYCGRFYWLKDDTAENPSLDDHNLDPDKRKKPLCGLTFLGGFSPQESDNYTGGWIYSPRHGSTYSAALHLVDQNTLAVRGYMFFSFLGGGQTWTRTESISPCPLIHKSRP